MTLPQIATRLIEAGYKPGTDDFELSLQRAWHGSGPVHKLADGTFDIDLHSHDLDYILLMTGAREPKRSPFKTVEQHEAWWADQRIAATKLRRAIIQDAWDDDHPGALTILDVGRHTLCTLVGDAISEAGHFLKEYDLIAGIGVFDTIRHLGLDAARWKLIDLASHQKSLAVNRQGRRIKLTTDMLMRASIGRTLGDPKKLAGYVAGNQATRLKRRIEADAKALCAFYRYAVLHRFLRVQWGFLDAVVPTQWYELGDMTLDDILTQSAEQGRPVDLVAGSAPGWTDPWSRAQRAYVAGIAEWEIMLIWENRRWIVGRCDVQAVRVVGEA